MILKIIQQIIQMFDKIQMILMMKMSMIWYEWYWMIDELGQKKTTRFFTKQRQTEIGKN